ncbi:hypothetical protein [Duncaniella muris]|uniref:hypothetical protein n=1 Tax=Duncaniella muris TaxID=2094150 RepID=UPI002715362C|nr:hypothetical protein [Duncaniella muris]
MKLTEKLSVFGARLGTSVKSLAKVALLGRRPGVKPSPMAADGKPLIILGNGPSLRALIDSRGEQLCGATTMALNFAANAEEFPMLRPDFYLLADPHFFEGRESDPNVRKMFERFNSLVDWPMTLYIPTSQKASGLKITNRNISIERFNFIGAEGFGWLERWLYGTGLAMPRPRNVLVPALMTAMLAGFRTIYLTGADHGWLSTLGVTEENTVVNFQPHFYKDNDEEHSRVASVYSKVRLHDVLLSFYLAFRSYHLVEAYAKSCGITVVNSTPGSFIDAFDRGPLPF